MEVYPTTIEETPVDQPRYALGKSIERVKAEVSPETYLSDRGVELKKKGQNLWCLCPVHQEKTSSCAVYADHVHCFGCGFHGDVIDLVQALEGGEMWEAMVTLSERYGVQIWQRPESWHSWQDEKGKLRRRLKDALAASYQRRFFRVYGTYLADIGDEEERRDEAEQFWNALRSVAQVAAENRMSR